MDASQQAASGFSPHVQEQLRDLGAAGANPPQPHRGRGQNGRGRGHHHHQAQSQGYQQNPVMATPNNQPSQQAWNGSPAAHPTDLSSFPPLGAARPNAGTQAAYQPQQYPSHQPAYYRQPQNVQYNQPRQNGPQLHHNSQREYFLRARGGPYRGAGQNRVPNNYQQQAPGPQALAQNADVRRRPPPAQNRLFSSVQQPYFSSPEQQREYQQRKIDQSDFLNHIANKSLKETQLTTEEQQAKEQFRKELETIAQRTIADASEYTFTFNPQHVQLKLYGSLGSGFGVSGCDMDLLLAFPQDEGSIGDIEVESRRMLEKALLDAGIGARLLTNTRVPILRVCQKPDPELLKNLRENRAKWEQSLLEEGTTSINRSHAPLPAVSDAQQVALDQALADLDLDAPNVPLPISPPPEHARLEYTGDCGIQCDINFSNYVALHNTRLLKTYGACDPRVRQVGVFLKAWAKARDINTPYYGTLSSYGYVLMVLHYLMNVASPPLIPNLQEEAKYNWEGPAEGDLVEGFDVRFVRDGSEVQKIIQGMPRNHESVGSLLRGLFQYYANPKGFYWNNEVVSIRTRGGQMTKRAKGWTEAKWAGENQSVRLRYLLAIEDPFEHEHNVARTVGHSGIVAIRDEFRRAWAAIENIQFDQQAQSWFWLSKQGERVAGDELMARIEKRGDLLRKDQDFHRQKMRQMKLEIEAKEKALKQAALEEQKSAEETNKNGMFRAQVYDVIEANTLSASSATEQALIANGAPQVSRNEWQDTPDLVAQEAGWWADSAQTEQTTDAIDWDASFTAAELGKSSSADEQEDLEHEAGLEEAVSEETPEGDDKTGGAAQEEEIVTTSVRDSGNSRQVTEESLPLIPWDASTKDGRWLLQRDRKIRAGMRIDDAAPKRKLTKRLLKLHQNFSYDPNMTITELARKNDMLRSSSWVDIEPCVTPASQRDESSVKADDIQTVTGGKSRRRSKYTNSATGPAKKSPAKLRQNNSDMDEKPKSDVRDEATAPQGRLPRRNNIRRQQKSRNEYKDTSAIASTDGAAVPDSRQAHTAAATMSAEEVKETVTSQDRGELRMSLLNILRSSHSPRLSSNAAASSASATKAGAEAPINTQMSTQSPQPVTPHDWRKDMAAGGTSQTEELVPLTLYPRISNERRPRDEDPNVMPIPRKLGFQFDPRQLADLEVIRQGGNGCARTGEEYSVEVDYEWGGGGEMADKCSGGDKGS